ncbi:hypothetical protein N7451_012243 [Penicillium sp. IBT 35674x]|nr:hypothetical protein N7451_012243 [Penicillium sp. IBT 35674x]
MYHARTSHPKVAYRVYRPVIASKRRSQTQWLEGSVVQRFIRARVQRAWAGRVIVYGGTKR